MVFAEPVLAFFASDVEADEQEDQQFEGTSGSAVVAVAVDSVLIRVGRVEFEYQVASALGLVVLAGYMLVLSDYLAVAVVADCIAVAGYKGPVAELQAPCIAEKYRWCTQ